jgi:hypothetical protein
VRIEQALDISDTDYNASAELRGAKLLRLDHAVYGLNIDAQRVGGFFSRESEFGHGYDLEE